MKTYVKPEIELVRLAPEESIATVAVGSVCVLTGLCDKPSWNFAPVGV